MNPFSLEGKRVLITGASSGIGRQIAISCAGIGATCVVTGRDAGRLAETFASLGPGEHISTLTDLTDATQRNASASQTETRLNAATAAKQGQWRPESVKAALLEREGSRYCWICGDPGGNRAASALNAAGFRVPEGESAYAHPDCLLRFAVAV